MRVWLLRKRIGVALIGVALVAACSTQLVRPDGLNAVADTDRCRPRPGDRAGRCRTWLRRRSTSRGRLWCRRAGRCRCGPASPRPRLAAWAPDGSLLVSRAEQRAGGAARAERSGHSAIGARSTAWTSRTVWRSRVPRSTSPRAIRSTPTTTPTAQRPTARTVAAGLPDARSPDLGGAYAHALKSVAVGPGRRGVLLHRLDGQHLRRRPHREPAARHHHADPARRRARRSRSRPACATAPGLAIAPDGSVWTAVNNRDNVAIPDQVRRTARSTPTTSTTTRRSPLPG